MATTGEHRFVEPRSTPRNFPLPITELESTYLVEKLIEIAVAEVFAFRRVFKQKRFEKALFLGETVTVLKQGKENQHILAIFNGLRDAIRKKFLRAVLVTIGEKTKENELEPQEAYKFTIANAESVAQTAVHSKLAKSRRAAAIEKLVPFLESLRTTLLAEANCESDKRHFIITLQLNKRAPANYRIELFSRNYSAPDTSSLAELNNEVISTRFHVLAATSYVPKQHMIMEADDSGSEESQIGNSNRGDWSDDRENDEAGKAIQRKAYDCDGSKASDGSDSSAAAHSNRLNDRQTVCGRSNEHDNSQSQSNENDGTFAVPKKLKRKHDSTVCDDSRVSFIKHRRRSSSGDGREGHDHTLSRIPVHDYEQTPACGPFAPVGRVLFLVDDRTNESFANLNGSLVSIGNAGYKRNLGRSKSSWNIGSQSQYFASDSQVGESCASQENESSQRATFSRQELDSMSFAAADASLKLQITKRVHFSEVADQSNSMGERVRSNANSSIRRMLIPHIRTSNQSSV